MAEILLAGLRFVFVVLIYLFLWHVLRLMYLELGPGHTLKRSPAARGRPVLTVLEAKNGNIKRGERYFLGENITIGRDKHNDIVINDIHVSARHAVITRSGEEWQLLDLDSTNGTYVNGQLLTGPQSLRPGDQVRIGGVTFKVGWEDASRRPFPYRTGAAR
ncbi:FHA domain-containing protein [Moorella stamsii]|uniref:FHA domain-containing protein n=1 Tax=Neomoorella stamsii TaxID=1266720 RepID=UPI00137AE824|nr:FHA domain-containing protein [Moorella stamsii]